MCLSARWRKQNWAVKRLSDEALRRYGGWTHALFGMGFEMLVGWVGGVDNVGECIPMPGWAGRMLLVSECIVQHYKLLIWMLIIMMSY